MRTYQKTFITRDQLHAEWDRISQIKAIEFQFTCGSDLNNENNRSNALLAFIIKQEIEDEREKNKRICKEPTSKH